MAHPKNRVRRARIDLKGYLTSAVIVGDGIARNLLNLLAGQSEPPITLGNMRALGLRWLLVSCMNDACRYEIAICVDRYTRDVEMRSFRSCMKCGMCGSEDVQVQPNWKEAPGTGRPGGIRFGGTK